MTNQTSNTRRLRTVLIPALAAPAVSVLLFGGAAVGAQTTSTTEAATTVTTADSTTASTSASTTATTADDASTTTAPTPSGGAATGAGGTAPADDGAPVLPITLGAIALAGGAGAVVLTNRRRLAANQ